MGTGTHTHTHTHTHTSPTSIPLATAAVLQEAAVPLADQILSVTFPLINGHLLPPFSLHGYTLSLCSSNHLIVMTFNPSEIVCLRVSLCLPACLLTQPTLLPAYLPATYQLGRRKGTQTNKPMRQCSSGGQTSHFCLSKMIIIPGNLLAEFSHFQKHYFTKQKLELTV